MDKASKERLVAKYVELFDGHEAFFLVKNAGLSVLDSKYIRAKFKPIEAKFMVAKNSLAKIALTKAKFSNASDLFVGPVAVAYADDPISVSKLLVEFCKEGKKLEIIGGNILGKQLGKDDIISLSKMPTENEIRAKIIGLVRAVASKIVTVLNEPGGKLARVISAYSKNNKH